MDNFINNDEENNGCTDETEIITNDDVEKNSDQSKKETPFLKFFSNIKNRGSQKENKVIHIKRKKMAFWSPIPGSGAKETAVNTAVMLSQFGEGDVCIVDLDFYNPSLDYLLNIKPNIKENPSYVNKDVVYSSLYSLLEDGSASKDRDVPSYLVQHEKYKDLFVATGFYGCVSPENISIETIMDFIDKCYNEFDYVILICSGYIGIKGLSEIFKACDIVYSVMEANDYQFYRVSNYINLLNDSNYMEDTKLRFIVNKFEASRNIEVKQIYSQFGYKVCAVINYDPLHIVCRSTRKFFVDECNSKGLKEYVQLLEDIGYTPNAKALKKFYK